MRKRRVLAAVAMAGQVFCWISATEVSAAEGEAVPVVKRGQLDTISVTARKQVESLQTIPVAVTAFSAQSLEDQKVVNISDIQFQTPSLTIAPASSDPLSNVISIRGQVQNDTLLSLQPSVGIYFDGVYYGQTTGSVLSTFIDVNRVEILKGPQGTLYGKNTTGGALAIYTELPSDEFEGMLRAGYGNYDSREVAGVVNIPFANEKAGMRLVGSYIGNNGYARDVFHDKRLDATDNVVLRGTLRFNPNDDLEIIVRGDYSHGKNTGVRVKPILFNPDSIGNAHAAAELFGVDNAFDPDSQAASAAAFQEIIDLSSDGKTYSYNEPEFSRAEAYGTSLTVSLDLTEDLELKSITAYRHLSRQYLLELDGSPFDIADGFGDTRAKQFTQEFNLSGRAFDGRLSWIVGAFYYRMTGTEIGINVALPLLNDTAPSIGDSAVLNESVAGFAQATYSITDDLRFTGGIRWTNDRSRLTTRSRDSMNCQVPVVDRIDGMCVATYRTSAEDVSYTAGFDYSIGDTTLIYVKTSKGFKGGGFNQRGSLSEGSFDPFEPETVTDYEFGLKTDLLDQRVRFNFAAFLSDYKNIQRSILVVGPGGSPNTIVQNAASARVHGVEAELDIMPVEDLLLRATVSFTDPKYKSFVDGVGTDLSDQPFFLVPKWSYSLAATYTADTGFGELRTSVIWHWQDKVNLSPASDRALAAFVDQPSYGLLDARISFRPEGDPDLEIAFWAKNITDESYYTRSLDLSPSLGAILQYVGTPRTFGITVQKNF